VVFKTTAIDHSAISPHRHFIRMPVTARRTGAPVLEIWCNGALHMPGPGCEDLHRRANCLVDLREAAAQTR
jgi:hypothetical protein